MCQPFCSFLFVCWFVLFLFHLFLYQFHKQSGSGLLRSDHVDFKTSVLFHLLFYGVTVPFPILLFGLFNMAAPHTHTLHNFRYTFTHAIVRFKVYCLCYCFVLIYSESVYAIRRISMYSPDMQHWQWSQHVVVNQRKS